MKEEENRTCGRGEYEKGLFVCLGHRGEKIRGKLKKANGLFREGKMKLYEMWRDKPRQRTAITTGRVVQRNMERNRGSPRRRKHSTCCFSCWSLCLYTDMTEASQASSYRITGGKCVLVNLTPSVLLRRQFVEIIHSLRLQELLGCWVLFKSGQSLLWSVFLYAEEMMKHFTISSVGRMGPRDVGGRWTRGEIDA